MKKKIKIIKIISIIIVAIQLIGGGVFCSFYFENVFSLQETLPQFFFPIALAAIFVIDCVYILFLLFYFLILKKTNELKTAEIIGNDIQEAYNFAEVGLVITDDKNNIFWTNELFRERHIDIIGLNIFDWQPSLSIVFKENKKNEPIKIVANNRNYEVKYIYEAGLWIFKDTTDLEEVYKFSRDQSTVIGILSIDNYDDLVRGDDDFNFAVNNVRNVILNYAKDYGLLLKRIKDDNYFILCNFETFEDIKKDNFSLIDKARKAGVVDDVPLTLSIGFAYEFPDINKLHEMALAALDIAMSRGGDQVVVSQYGQDMEFFGGKSEAVSTRSRVKIRVLADSLNNIIKTSSNVLIMGHTIMDMDAFGACLGLKAICDSLKIPAKIVVDLKATEFKTRACITSVFSKEQLDKLIATSRDSSALIKPETLLIVADVHIPGMTMAPDLLDKVSKIVVIDHHRRAEKYIDSTSLVYNHIDSSSSSTCELISEFIKYSTLTPKIELMPIYATIMLAGIFLDTSYFKSRTTGIRTFEAASILKEFGADNAMADDLLKDNYEEYSEVNGILSNMITPEYGVVVSVADVSRLYDSATIAKAANACLSLKGNHAAFVIGKTGEGEVRISARSDGTINVQYLTEKLGGGGHFSSAAVALATDDIISVKENLLAVLSTELKNAYSSKTNMESED